MSPYLNDPIYHTRFDKRFPDIYRKERSLEQIFLGSPGVGEVVNHNDLKNLKTVNLSQYQRFYTRDFIPEILHTPTTYNLPRSDTRTNGTGVR